MSNDNYLQPRKSISENVDMKHLLEVNGLCPLCGKSLIQDKIIQNEKITTNKLYEIAHIFPNSPTEEEKKLLSNVEKLGTSCEDFDNKIALCKECHRKYDNKKTVYEYNNLLAIKKELLLQSKTTEQLNKQIICNNIKEIFTQLKNFKTQEEQLNISAKKLKNKIYKTETLLFNKVSMNVSFYFNYINEYFKSNYKSTEFDLIASQIRAAFCTCNNYLDNQSDIFTSMCEWLQNKCPGFNKESYEAVISYFIQDCEVFNEISK